MAAKIQGATVALLADVQPVVRVRLTNDIICHDPRSADENQAGQQLLTFKKYKELFGRPPTRFSPLRKGWKPTQS